MLTDRRRALFPPWSDLALRIGLVGAAASGALAIATPLVAVRTPFIRNQLVEVDQPVEFDHRHHVADDGIECRYCHSTVERARTAGIPSTDLCMGCHSQVWNDSPMLEVVRRSYFSGASIPYTRVHRVPDFVYFDHSAHSTRGVGCVSCHGKVDEMAKVYQVAPLTMEWCLDCHRAPERHLRPLAFITSTDWAPPSRDAEAFGRELARELGVRSLVTCSTCHR